MYHDLPHVAHKLAGFDLPVEHGQLLTALEPTAEDMTTPCIGGINYLQPPVIMEQTVKHLQVSEMVQSIFMCV